MALVDYLDKVVPAWMRRAPADHWFGLALTVAAVFDAMLDGVLDAAFADMPGQTEGSDEFSSTDALPFIGRDARIPQGFLEAIPDYASRLRDPYAIHRRAGTPFGLLHEVANILLPNPPRIRMVNPQGQWWTLDSDGTFTLQTASGKGFVRTPDGAISFDSTTAFVWDWDSQSNPPPPDANDPSRIWLIIYAPCNGVYLAGDEGKWGDGKSKYGDFQKVTGTSQTSPHVELLRGVANAMRTAGIRLSHIIVTYDPASFDPASAPGASGMPDGYWGNHAEVEIIAGVPYRTRRRNPRARYGRGHAGTDY